MDKNNYIKYDKISNKLLYLIIRSDQKNQSIIINHLKINQLWIINQKMIYLIRSNQKSNH
jgi:hypothetical protein